MRDYDEAYKLKRKMQDERDYFMGIYTYEAVTTALANAFRDKGKKPYEYRKKPILLEYEEEKGNLSEDQLKAQRELFVAKLMAMQSNFELNHKKADKENQLLPLNNSEVDGTV